MKSNVITKQMKMDWVADHWKATYFDPETLWRDTINGSTFDIWEKLKQLNPKTEAGIAAIIGNESWTRLQCDYCKNDNERIYCFSFFTTSSIYLCQNCLDHAVKELKESYE